MRDIPALQIASSRFCFAIMRAACLLIPFQKRRLREKLDIDNLYPKWLGFPCRSRSRQSKERSFAPVINFRRWRYPIIEDLATQTHRAASFVHFYDGVTLFAMKQINRKKFSFPCKRIKNQCFLLSPCLTDATRMLMSMPSPRPAGFWSLHAKIRCSPKYK